MKQGYNNKGSCAVYRISRTTLACSKVCSFKRPRVVITSPRFSLLPILSNSLSIAMSCLPCSDCADLDQSNSVPQSNLPQYRYISPDPRVPQVAQMQPSPQMYVANPLLSLVNLHATYFIFSTGVLLALLLTRLRLGVNACFHRRAQLSPLSLKPVSGARGEGHREIALFALTLP